MKFCTLFSGSSGNCIYVEYKNTRVLFDAGKNTKHINLALAGFGLSLKDIDGIFLTHGHSDHISAIPVIASKYGMPVFAKEGVLSLLVERHGIIPSRLTLLSGNGTFTFKDLKITPFSTPHDAQDSVGYHIAGDGEGLTIATDLGFVTDEIYSHMKSSNFVIIESNYDPDMLANGPYPYPLKMRVQGSHGHLSNGDCAYTVCRLAQDGIKHFMLAHLSENNNRPELAFSEVCGALAAAGYTPGQVTVNVAPRHFASGMFEF